VKVVINEFVEKLQEAEAQPKTKDDLGILYFEERLDAYRKKMESIGPNSKQIRFLAL
jgi:hypothetical protein